MLIPQRREITRAPISEHLLYYALNYEKSHKTLLLKQQATQLPLTLALNSEQPTARLYNKEDSTKVLQLVQNFYASRTIRELLVLPAPIEEVVQRSMRTPQLKYAGRKNISAPHHAIKQMLNAAQESTGTRDIFNFFVC